MTTDWIVCFQAYWCKEEILNFFLKSLDSHPWISELLCILRKKHSSDEPFASLYMARYLRIVSDSLWISRHSWHTASCRNWSITKHYSEEGRYYRLFMFQHYQVSDIWHLSSLHHNCRRFKFVIAEIIDVYLLLMSERIGILILFVCINGELTCFRCRKFRIQRAVFPPSLQRASIL